MKKRRTTRYDERLNSIHTGGTSQSQSKAINHESVNEEDLDDFQNNP
jgi:hypothetical protein